MSQVERSFGGIHFGGAVLGNTARTKRLVMVADALVRHSGGTLPDKIKNPAALQATYRLMQRREVLPSTILSPPPRRGPPGRAKSRDTSSQCNRDR